MQHLNLLQIQEFGISELKVDPIVRAYTAMNNLAQQVYYYAIHTRMIILLQNQFVSIKRVQIEF